MEIRLGTTIEVRNVADNTLEDRGVITDILVVVDKNRYSIIMQSEVRFPGANREFGYFADDKCWQVLTITFWSAPHKGSDPDGARYRLSVVSSPRPEEHSRIPAAVKG